MKNKKVAAVGVVVPTTLADVPHYAKLWIKKLIVNIRFARWSKILLNITPKSYISDGMYLMNCLKQNNES
jgi:hypothetical protein